MKISTPIIISFIYFFLIQNLFGWGILKDGRFIALVVFLGILYLGLDLISFLKKESLFPKLKFLVVFLFIGLAVFGGAISLMKLRAKTLPFEFINDSALQTEISGKYLLLGLNPYKESFAESNLAEWSYLDDEGGTTNPALFQNVHSPLPIIVSAIGFRIFAQAFGWFDFRVFLLAAYLSLLVLGWLKFGFKEEYLLFLGLVGLNPYFIGNMMWGTNDILVLAFLFWSLFSLGKKKFLWTGILFGLGLATKQTLWLAAPFYLFYVWQKYQPKGFRPFLLGLIVSAGILFLPFAVWDFKAILNSLVFYVNSSPVAGLITHPIEGHGFAKLVLTLGWVDSIYDPYPFWLWQAVSGLGLMVGLLFLMKKKVSQEVFLWAYVLMVAVVWFFNRYLLESHLAYLMVLVSLVYLWPKSTQAKRKSGGEK